MSKDVGGRPKLDGKPVRLKSSCSVVIKIDSVLAEAIYREQMKVFDAAGYSVPASTVVRKLAIRGFNK